MEFAKLTRRTNDPKLRDLEKRLDAMGIAHRRNGESMHAPILEVDIDRKSDAWDILDIEIDGREYDDIPDDDPMFI